MKVEHVPPNTPKLNNMVERGFAIRLETANTLMQNSVLKPNLKKNGKIIVEAIVTVCFLKEECPHKGKRLSVNEIFWR